MPQPRHTQVDPDATPYYHCISRCVRRAFLCGEDRVTGRNFDHRKSWVVNKLAALTEIFAVDLCAYSVLSSHFHLVVRLDPDSARGWTDEEVLDRYGRLFRTPAAEARRLPADKKKERVATFRTRLQSLSWFMRCLNESIARRANREDKCTGRFWEGRFRCQPLLDEGALLTCMSYVDLNPVRAGLAESLEGSEFTSIQQRLWEVARQMHGERQQIVPEPKGNHLPELLPFAMAGKDEDFAVLPIDFAGYAELVGWAGSVVREGKRGALPAGSEKVLNQLGLEPEAWLETVQTFHRRFFAMVGHVHRIAMFCERTGRCRAKGSVWATRLYKRAA